MFSYKKIYVFATAVPQLRCNQAKSKEVVFIQNSVTVCPLNVCFYAINATVYERKSCANVMNYTENDWYK